MNICVITSAMFPPEEGIGNYIYNMSREFIRKGHEVTVITRGGLYGTRQEELEGIRVIKTTFIPSYPFHVHVHQFYVKRALRSLGHQFDVIHYHTPLPPVVKTDLPILTTVHTPMKTEGRLVKVRGPFSLATKCQGKISCRIEQDLFAISDKITSVASSVAGELREYGLDPADVEVVYNGVDDKIFRPARKKKGDQRYILYTGRLIYRKGLFDLIESFKRIASAHGDVGVKVVGKGQILEAAKKAAKKAGCADRFQFLGYVSREELVELYQNATMVVLPSHYEGLPTTVLEAMACGAPVIATAVSGNLDVIEDGKNGLLVPPRSPESIAGAISLMLADESMRQRLGSEARKTIESRYNWNAVSDKILDCYRSIIWPSSN